MKRFCIFLFVAVITAHAQLSFTTETQKHSYYNGRIFGYTKISDDQLIIGNMYTDLEGNSQSQIPGYLGWDFTFTTKGAYVGYETKMGFIEYKTGYVESALVNTTKSTGSIQKTDIKSNRSMIGSSKGGTCYRTTLGEGFMKIPDEVGDKGIVKNINQIHVLDEAKVERTIDIKSEIGRKIGEAITKEGFYYALFGNQTELMLAKANLNTGKVDYKIIDDDKKNYSGGILKIVGGVIYAGAFYGECSYNFTSNSEIHKADGIKTFKINETTLMVEQSADQELPSEYQELFTLSGKRASSAYIMDLLPTGNTVYFVSGNKGGITMGSEIGAPMLLWKMEGNQLTLVSTISGTGSGKSFPNSAKMFTYNSKNYLMFSSKHYPKNDYYYNFNLIELTNDIGENPPVETIDFIAEKIDMQIFDISGAYISPGGKIIVVGNDRSYKSITFMKVDIP